MTKCRDYTGKLSMFLFRLAAIQLSLEDKRLRQGSSITFSRGPKA